MVQVKKEHVENSGPIKEMYSLKDVVMITFSPWYFFCQFVWLSFSPLVDELSALSLKLLRLEKENNIGILINLDAGFAWKVVTLK